MLVSLSAKIDRLQQSPGRLVQTLEQASLDVWTSEGVSGVNTNANTSVSYYVKPPSSNEPTAALRSISPQTDARVTSQTTFVWAGEASGSTLIRFSVFERTSLTQLSPTSASVDPLSKPATGALQSTDLFPVKGVEVFSATLPAGATSYSLKSGQWERLGPDKGYLWQAQAIDADGKIISETELRSFKASAPQPAEAATQTAPNQ